MTLEKLTDYHGDAVLQTDILDLLTPSYEKIGAFALHGIAAPIAGMRHELFISRNEAGRLLAFFMVGYDDTMGRPTCYLGLSGCREENKSQGLTSQLYAAFLAQHREREDMLGQRILLYATTATPFAFGWCTKTLAEVNPDAQGRCTPEGLLALTAVATAHYARAHWEAATPYLLRGVAPDVRYSEHEQQRIAETLAMHPTSFFNSVNLKERDGDRLLIVGYAPSTSPSSSRLA